MAHATTPTLFSLSLAATEAVIEREVADYYKEHPISGVLKDSFSIPSAFERRLSGLFSRATTNPLDTYVTALPPGILDHIANPSLLSRSIQVHGRSTSTERDWEAICKKYLPSTTRPHGLNWEQTFYSHFFQQSLIGALGKFSSLPPEVQALYFDNREEVHALHFSKTSTITDGQIKNLSKMFPSRHYFHVHHCPHVTKESIKKVTQDHPELEHLHLINVTTVDDDVLKTAARNCKGLKSLELSTLSPGLSKEALLRLVRANPNLERIELGRFRSLDDETLAEIVLSCPSLQFLKVQDCPNVTPDFFDRVFTKSSHLQELHIVRCDGFKDLNVSRREEHYSLDVLEITECKSLSAGAKEALLDKFPYRRERASFSGEPVEGIPLEVLIRA